jgi:hypothetical protein
MFIPSLLSVGVAAEVEDALQMLDAHVAVAEVVHMQRRIP